MSHLMETRDRQIETGRNLPCGSEYRGRAVAVSARVPGNVSSSPCGGRVNSMTRIHCLLSNVNIKLYFTARNYELMQLQYLQSREMGQ